MIGYCVLRDFLLREVSDSLVPETLHYQPEDFEFAGSQVRSFAMLERSCDGGLEMRAAGGVNGTNRLNQRVMPDILLQVSVHVLDLGADVNAANSMGQLNGPVAKSRLGR
jgi:hypothetical protein